MEEFVPFEISKKLKEKGFDYPCVGHYVNNQLYIAHYQNAFHSDKDESLDAPIVSQVLKWLREEKKIHIGVLYHNYYAVWIQPMKHNEAEHVIHDCKTHEGAELEGIEFVLDNLI